MTDPFAPGSRYYGVPIRNHVEPDGTTRSFVGRRIVPAPERYRVLDRVRVDGHRRIDAVAADAYGDPELYWRICDANGDADPGLATTPAGRLVAIPLPLEIADDGES